VPSFLCASNDPPPTSGRNSSTIAPTYRLKLLPLLVKIEPFGTLLNVPAIQMSLEAMSDKVKYHKAVTGVKLEGPNNAYTLLR
jgi:hypothetical protein